MQDASDPGTRTGLRSGRHTDRELHRLLSRCALRDPSALRSLYDAVAAKLNGVAYRITGSRDMAEDVLQISLIQIWESAPSYRPDLGRPMTWLTSIVRHRALDRVRAERRRHRVVDEAVELEAMQLVSADPGPPEHFALHQTSGRLDTCLKRLSDAQRHAVMLAYYYGHTREETAEKLNAAVGTVKSWLHRALRRLEQCLTRH